MTIPTWHQIGTAEKIFLVALISGLVGWVGYCIYGIFIRKDK